MHRYLDARRSRRFTAGWAMLLLIAALMALNHLVLLFVLDEPLLFLGFAAFCAYATLVVAIPFHRGERWAWYATWMLPIGLGVPALTDPQITLFYSVAALICMLGLLLSMREFFVHALGQEETVMRERPIHSRARYAGLGAALTALTLVGTLLVAFGAGHVTSEAFTGRIPRDSRNIVAAIPASLIMLLGCGVWGVSMAWLSRSPWRWRAAGAGMLGFVPATIAVAFGLAAAEPLAFGAELPIHRLFTMLFVPSAGLVAAISSLSLGVALGWGAATPMRALGVGLAAAGGFLAANLVMEALGWQVGGPGAAERATMLTVLLVGNLTAALAGGAALGLACRSALHPRPHASLEPREAI